MKPCSSQHVQKIYTLHVHKWRPIEFDLYKQVRGEKNKEHMLKMEEEEDGGRTGIRITFVKEHTTLALTPGHTHSHSLTHPFSEATFVTQSRLHFSNIVLTSPRI